MTRDTGKAHGPELGGHRIDLGTWTHSPDTADGHAAPLPIYPQASDLPPSPQHPFTRAEQTALEAVLARGIPVYDQEPTMPNTDHQLAEGVCESIAHTTPRFRPPSRGMTLLRGAIAWVAFIAALLFIVAVFGGSAGAA